MSHSVLITFEPLLLQDFKVLLAELHKARQMYDSGQRRTELSERIARLELLYGALKDSVTATP